MKQAATLIFTLFAAIPINAAAIDIPIFKTTAKPQAIQVKDLKNSDVSAEVLFKLMAAEMAINRDQLDLALKNYIEVAEETQDAAVAQRATQIALSIASLEEAYVPAQIWADQAPGNLEAQITLSAVLLRLGKSKDAVPYLRRIGEIDPIDGDRHYVMLYKQLPDAQDREHVWQSLISLSSETKQNLAYVALSDIALFQNDFEKSLDFAKKALKINPEDPKASILYAQTLHQQKQTDKAAQFIKQQLEKMPRSLHLRQYYIQFLLDNDMRDQAQAEMKVLAEQKNIDPKQQLQLARLSMQEGWYDVAERLLHKVREDKEQLDTANYFLARLYESQDNAIKAADWYEQVKRGPFHIIAYIRATTLLGEKGEYERAISMLDRAQPQNFADVKRLLLARVDIMNLNRDYQGAFALLGEALQAEPEDIDFLYTRAVLADKLNKIDVAEKDLKAILAEDPNHIDALNALGFILANKTTRLEEAHEYIMQALHLSPNNPSILDSLGWVKFKMGKTDEAIQILRKAFNLYPDPEIAAHLGEVLYSSNQVDEANKVWSDALKSSPDNPDVIQTMKRLIGENDRH